MFVSSGTSDSRSYEILIFIGGYHHLDGLEETDSVEHRIEVVRVLWRRIYEGLLC